MFTSTHNSHNDRISGIIATLEKEGSFSTDTHGFILDGWELRVYDLGINGNADEAILVAYSMTKADYSSSVIEFIEDFGGANTPSSQGVYDNSQQWYDGTTR